MSITVKLGYGQKHIFNDSDDVTTISDRFFNSAHKYGPEYFYYFDSDTNIIRRGHIDSDGNTIWTKVVYRTFPLIPDSDQDLRNAYGIPSHFTDKNQVYPYGKLFRDSDKEGIATPFVVHDSEGYHIWRKYAGTDGSQKSHYNVGGYWYDQPRLTSMEMRPYVYNTIDSTFNIYYSKFQDNLVTVQGTNLVPDSDSERYIQHGNYNGLQAGSVHLRNKDFTNNLTISEFLNDTTAGTATVNRGDSLGTVYTPFRSKDDKTYQFRLAQRLNYDSTLRLVYHNEFTDSEISATIPYSIDSDIDFVPTLTENHVDVVHNFHESDGFHIDNPPWLVFDDSDNTGFKASLGRQSGYIGWNRSFSNYFYTLKEAWVRNTPATQDNSKPYDYDIEGYFIDSERWVVVHSVRNSTKIVNHDIVNSTLPCSGFRVKVLQCQPGFDSEQDSLEIKDITFIVNRIRIEGAVQEVGAFFTQSGVYTFTIGDSDVRAKGLFVGGGGGGTESPWGYPDGFSSGGGGGGYVRVKEIRLKAHHTYEISRGDAGAVGNDGGDSYLKDVTNNQVIVLAGGGGRGQVKPNSNRPVTLPGGTGGVAQINTSNHTINAVVHPGGAGGTSVDDRVELWNASTKGYPGQNGVIDDSDSETYFYSDKFYFTKQKGLHWGGGGGAGIYWQSWDVDGGEDSGGPQYQDNGPGNDSAGWGNRYTLNALAGVTNRGGGGGGDGTSDRDWETLFHSAMPGGSGYAYLIFYK